MQFKCLTRLNSHDNFIDNKMNKMNKKLYVIPFFFVCIIWLFYACDTDAQIDVDSKEMVLKDNWAIRSSAEISADGAKISMTGYQAEDWHKVTFPSTVLAGLVDNDVFADPYYGTNIEDLPGYPVDFRHVILPGDSPFNIPWWYRTCFTLPEDYSGKNIRLNFHGINYRANIWLNGNMVADTSGIEGAYRLYDFDVTEFITPGSENCLAIEIFPPHEGALTISWVDWNPSPPDFGMGIWYDVTLRAAGKVDIINPQVITDLDLPALDRANLTVSAEIRNNENEKTEGILKGKIEDIEFSLKTSLLPGETKTVTFSPEKFEQLQVSNPRLWWPHTMGEQNLYDLTLTFETGGSISDLEKTRFGIREVTSWMNEFDGKRTRVFQINGKNLVIRGGGYVQDMMLRPSKERIDNDIRYAKHMNLNALRMEAPRGSDYMFDRCDEEGILLIVGWCCCSPWEQWSEWDSHTADIAQKSWHDQIIHLRNHPSIFNWLLGSDFCPPEEVERGYISTLEKYDNTRPYQSSATREPSAIAGYTGVEMGPYRRGYSYMPPTYWYGKLEFNTEAGPGGEQIPPLETLKKMMPAEDLWPISKSWEIRLHKVFYPDARKALYSRYGEPQNLEEYIKKSQVLQQETIKAMFEAFAGNKYRSSGIIYWMYNSAWPMMYWQLYDYFFNPNGGFYGAKKACENLHIQYTYDDGSIQIVNGYHTSFDKLNASVQLYDLNMTEKFSKEFQTGIGADESKKILKIELPNDISDVYFLKLKLNDSAGGEVSSNFYWLSVKGDEEADFKALNDLPSVQLNCSVKSLTENNGKLTLVSDFENPSSTLAFSVNPKILMKDSGDPVLPIYWEDNYFSLLPNEKREVKVEFYKKDFRGDPLLLVIEGWNIIPEMLNIKPLEPKQQ